MNENTKPQRSNSELLELLTDRDLLILKDLEQLRLLSTRQIQRLRFDQHISMSSATRTTVRVLTRLEGHGLLTRLARRVGGPLRGSAATVWQLASTGERLLRHINGGQARRRYVEPSHRFSAHTVAVADIAIALMEADRSNRLDLLELQAEPDCWRDYTTAAGALEWLKPDLYVVTADDSFETHSFVEVDLATEHLPAILRKCQTYQRYFQSGAEQQRHDLFPAVLWLTTSDTRAQGILAAIHAEPSLNASLFQATRRDDPLALITPTPPTTL